MKTGKKRQKIMALLLAAMLAAGTCATASATTVAEGDMSAPVPVGQSEPVRVDYNYNILDDGTVEITGYTGSDTNLVIPSEIDGKKVTSIGNSAFGYCTGLTSVEIPDSVTSIGNDAFAYCTGLTSIKIPDSVTSIGNHAFAYCTGLTNIEIPNSVTSIENSAFYFCTGLTSIEIPNSVTSIGDNAFSLCEGLTSIEIPDSVTSIGVSAFFGCTGLTSIEIPDSVTSIERCAFLSCTSLKSVTIPYSVTSIDVLAFGYYNNNSIEKITDFTIYGTKGTAAETYANEKGFKFVDISIIILTSKVGNISVKGIFADKVILNVAETAVKNAVAAYDITLKDDNGKTIQPSEEITVSIPSDNANCKVYWIKDDNTKVDMNAVYTDGKYEFTTDHLSVYALIEDTDEPSQEPSNESSNESKPNESSNNTNNSTISNTNTSETGKTAVDTGDNSNATALFAILSAGIITAVTILFKKKRT